jgi:hypothetical protein
MAELSMGSLVLYSTFVIALQQDIDKRYYYQKEEIDRVLPGMEPDGQIDYLCLLFLPISILPRNGTSISLGRPAQITYMNQNPLIEPGKCFHIQ